MEAWFWVLLFIAFYAYFGYGLLLALWVKWVPKRIVPIQQEKPEVTLLIAAYNEIAYMPEKIENCRAQTYPNLKIVFVTDGSTDGSAEWLSRQDGIQVYHQPERRGKMAAINRVMREIQSPYTVFTDANTWLNPEAIERLVAHFADPTVGVVAGEKRIRQESQATAEVGEGLYWKYESTLKTWDAQVYSACGAAGELYAIRTPLFEELESDTLLDDFVLSLKIVMRGFRIAYEPQAYAAESASLNSQEELKRKIRICAGGFQSMVRLHPLLWKYGKFSFQYVSHRILRWTIVPFSLPFLFLLNVLLVDQHQHPIYIFFLFGQTFFYLLALLGWWAEKRGKKSKILSIPYYLVMMNYAAWAGFFRYQKGKQSVVWEKAQRAG